MVDHDAPLSIRRLTVRAGSEAEATQIAGEFRAGLAPISATRAAEAGANLRLRLAPGEASGTAAAQALANAVGGGDGR